MLSNLYSDQELMIRRNIASRTRADGKKNIVWRKPEAHYTKRMCCLLFFSLLLLLVFLRPLLSAHQRPQEAKIGPATAFSTAPWAACRIPSFALRPSPARGGTKRASALGEYVGQI